MSIGKNVAGYKVGNESNLLIIGSIIRYRQYTVIPAGSRWGGGTGSSKKKMERRDPLILVAFEAL
jgi:hypothetical protein